MGTGGRRLHSRRGGLGADCTPIHILRNAPRKRGQLPPSSGVRPVVLKFKQKMASEAASHAGGLQHRAHSHLTTVIQAIVMSTPAFKLLRTPWEEKRRETRRCQLDAGEGRTEEALSMQGTATPRASTKVAGRLQSAILQSVCTSSTSLPHTNSLSGTQPTRA